MKIHFLLFRRHCLSVEHHSDSKVHFAIFCAINYGIQQEYENFFQTREISKLTVYHNHTSSIYDICHQYSSWCKCVFTYSTFLAYQYSIVLLSTFILLCLNAYNVEYCLRYNAFSRLEKSPNELFSWFFLFIGINFYEMKFDISKQVCYNKFVL